jgi:ATP-dependent Lon protease
MTTPESETEFISILGAGGSPDASGTKVWSKSLPESLPILGLSDIVIFPGTVTRLLVETPQSIRLIDDVVAGDRFLGLVLQRKPETENPLPADLFSFGCAGRVLKMLKFPDGTVRVLVEGLRRFRILDYTSQAPYLMARHEKLKDVADESLELTALARNAEREFQEVIKLSPTLAEQVKIAALNTEDAGQAGRPDRGQPEPQPGGAPAFAGNAPVKDRLTRLLPLLSRELEVLKLGSKIQNEVVTSMSKNQRDFFLREQIRAIQRELGEVDPGAAEAKELREQIDANNLPEEPKQDRAQGTGPLAADAPAVAEYTMTRNYLDWLINLPWSKFTEDKLDLAAASRLLDEQHFGLRKVKDRLLEFLAVIKLKHQLKGPILCLVGPPGVGKTSLGKSVADALGRKFGRISLGGMRDEAEIRGHRRTYVGALPGRIIQTLRRLESGNPVILLDELDKVGSDFRGDPASALLEVLDPSQNNSFVDHYLDVPWDLSRVLFLTTANWLDPIHPALRDRLEVIELPSYTAAEKVQIAKRHLVPRQLEEHGLKKKLVRFPEATLRHLIQGYTREAGCASSNGKSPRSPAKPPAKSSPARTR